MSFEDDAVADNQVSPHLRFVCVANLESETITYGPGLDVASTEPWKLRGTIVWFAHLTYTEAHQIVVRRLADGNWHVELVP